MRRTPPLFEAVGGGAESRASAQSRPVIHGPNLNGSTVVTVPTARPAAPAPRAPIVVDPIRTASPSGQSKPKSRIAPIILMGAAAILLVGFVAWSVGYSRGQDAGKKAILQHTSPEEAAIITGQTTPPPPVVQGGSARPLSEQVPASSLSATSMPPVTGPEPRESGVNYLSIVTLTWKDAQGAVRFLQKNGVPATCVPAGKVDPASAQANNANHLVFVLDGIPSGQFKASESKRSELIAKVRTLGKRWQREERGASDFGDPSWVLFRGK